MIKLGAIAALVALFFGLFVFGPWYDDLSVQALVFAAIVGFYAARYSVKELFDALRSLLPFIASLLAFGLAFQLIHLQGRSDWLYDSAVKCLIFPSSLLFLRIALSYVTYLDLLRLPISMKERFALITAKSAFQKGGKYLGRFSWYLDTYPYLHKDGALQQRLRKYASLIVALYLYLYEETENANLLLQNRYRHLVEVEK